MGWTKHPYAVERYRGARSEALRECKKLAKSLREELEGPSDIHGMGIRELGSALHEELRRFVRLREAVGGDYDVAVGAYVRLVLASFHSFKWRTHVRHAEPGCS